jgi:subtilisin family serine protease
MRRVASVTVLATLIGAATATSQAGTIEPNLQAILSGARGQETVSALVYLSDRVDVDALDEQLDSGKATLRLRHEIVVTSLQERAAATQGNLLTQLDALQAKGLVQDYQPFWIANCVWVDATPVAIRAIAARPDVETVYYNYGIELTAPVDARSDLEPPRDDRDPEIGLVAIRAPEAWALGYTGAGILVATLDTGVDGNHPALASRWRGVADPRYAGHPEWAWFDPVTYTTFPQSFGAHGTHTMGTVCGGPPGDEIGVAPGAQWIHAAVINRVSIEQTVADAIAAFQWMLDPDGDPNTNWDVPHVCSNSWGLTTWHGYPPCDETFWGYLDACEAAGIVILFSAGSEGPVPGSISRPADRATDDYRTCAVGAVDANNPSWPVADFSSRGPSYCTPNGDAAIKPDIAAPGVNVRSSVPGGGYEQWSGTSMASPHVNGAIALVREACSDLTVEEVKQIIFQTAHDLGAPGEDNSYGWGMVDCYEAVQLALDWCSACLGDLDGDRDVDLADLAQLLAHYGMTSGAEYEDGDLDADGDVDLTDLAALLAAYGTSCE